jgi:hypothetical protein
MKQIQKKLFFIILALSVLAIIGQLYYCFFPLDIQVIIMGDNWEQSKFTLVLITFVLIVINIVAYKAEFSNSKANEIDTWFMASSVLILTFYILTRIAIPYTFFYSIGRLDLMF